MTWGLQTLKTWAQAVKRDVVALWIAARNRRTPWIARLIAGIVAAYALSPVDLIPDFIPIIGYLDDLIIVPLGIALVVRTIPAELMAEFRAEALERSGRPTSWIAAGAVIIVWLVVIAALVSWIFPKLR
ncbi:YkvA family protein [Aurantiacibacter marinus]|uniref:Membrane protein n=1 Tax=Aurantiacibacter marinus TaxID=874156 RepID=A0A0H0XM87_9SPHN|nr:YkvA family protein [Aurantiacibacter marinus]KLI63723.1 membrane protein [Aurantiacibacter marinus]